jgi:deoxyribodipyrimidine photo-lyase
MSNSDLTIFVFRNDLRLQDNIGLFEALKASKKVLPVYLLENLDLFKLSNNNKQQFIIESLIDLNNDLIKKSSALFILKNISELQKIVKNKKINSVFINRLYHPKYVLQEKNLNLFAKEKRSNLIFLMIFY